MTVTSLLRIWSQYVRLAANPQPLGHLVDVRRIDASEPVCTVDIATISSNYQHRVVGSFGASSTAIP